MRVIAGSARGKRLETRRVRSLRPTSDYIREVLFNILRDRVRDSRFLDLFAGSGAVGIEALSRGAQKVTFVERDPFSIRLIRRNLERLGLLAAGELFQGEALRTLESLKAWGKRYSLIYVDPPYQGTLAEDALEAISRGSLLEDEGLVVVEHFHKRGLPQEVGCLKKLREKRHGQAKLSIYGKP